MSSQGSAEMLISEYLPFPIRLAPFMSAVFCLVILIVSVVSDKEFMPETQHVSRPLLS